MNEASMRAFEVNGPSAVSETIDGEVVIVNLESGAYYSIRGFGATLWTALESGHSVAAILAELAAVPHGDADLERAVESFVTSLIEEKLLRPAEREQVVSAPSLSGDDYSQPRFEKFSDMEAL